MALTDPKDTLAYHSSRVFCVNRDMRHVECADVAKAVRNYGGTVNDPESNPEGNALMFYGMNHGMALISAKFDPLEPLPKDMLDFVNAYHSMLVPRAVRAFYYLLLICTREARHNQSLSKDYDAMAGEFGVPIASFFKSITGGESSIHSAFVNTPPAGTIGEYCRCMQWQFYNSKWANGYGGKAWGAIADCLYRFVSGEYSPEMMLDTIWTLSHNNGPIFNKGIYYGMYTPKMLLRILDVQRSGQVPEAVLYDVISNFAPVALMARMQWLEQAFPGKIGGFVDWHAVSALGAIGNYKAEKIAQEAAGNMSPEAKLEAEKKLKKKQEKLLAAEEALKNSIEIMPNVWVPKIKMSRAA